MAVKPLPLDRLIDNEAQPPPASTQCALPSVAEMWDKFASPSAPTYMKLGTKSVGSPRSIQEYSLDHCELIGRGGDSSIVLTSHERLGQMAIKITEKAGRRPEQIGRSRFEAYLLVERLSHPNIVRAYDWLETPDHILLSLEYASFGDLLELVNLRKGFSESDASKIIAQLASGLAAAHELGVVHGDVKLENVRQILSIYSSRISICRYIFILLSIQNY